jgi:hypothetical protein
MRKMAQKWGFFEKRLKSTHNQDNYLRRKEQKKHPASVRTGKYGICTDREKDRTKTEPAAPLPRRDPQTGKFIRAPWH